MKSAHRVPYRFLKQLGCLFPQGKRIALCEKFVLCSTTRSPAASDGGCAERVTVELDLEPVPGRAAGRIIQERKTNRRLGMSGLNTGGGQARRRAAGGRRPARQGRRGRGWENAARYGG